MKNNVYHTFMTRTTWHTMLNAFSNESSGSHLSDDVYHFCMPRLKKKPQKYVYYREWWSDKSVETCLCLSWFLMAENNAVQYLSKQLLLVMELKFLEKFSKKCKCASLCCIVSFHVFPLPCVSGTFSYRIFKSVMDNSCATLCHFEW